jgi:hypothetical protein
MDSSNSDTFKASYRNYLVDVGPAEYLFFQNLRVSWRITCLHTSEVNRPSKLAGVTFLSEDALFTTQLTSSSFFAFILLPVWYVLNIVDRLQMCFIPLTKLWPPGENIMIFSHCHRLLPLHFMQMGIDLIIFLP